MKKLKLAPESLEVTTFEPIFRERRDRGTVQGASEMVHTDYEGCEEFTGAYADRCTGAGCDHTMMITCAGCYGSNGNPNDVCVDTIEY